MAEEKLVKCSMRDRTGHIVKDMVPVSLIPGLLQEFERYAAKLLKKTGAAHVLYGAKIYGSGGKLAAVQLYMDPMNELDFDRGPARSRVAVIYALHRR